MPAPQAPSALAVLPDNYKALLYVLALSFPGQLKTALVRHLREMGVRASAARAFDAASLNEILEPLQRLQWLSEAGSGQPICLLPGRRNLVLQQLSGDSNKDRWLDLLRSSLGAPRAGWEVQTQEYQLHSLWLAILQGQAFELRQILERLASWQVEAPAQQLFSDDAGKQVFASVGQEVQILLLQDYLNQLNWRLQPAAEVYRVALTLFKRAPQQAELGLQLTLQALWRGDWAQFSRLVEEVAAVPGAFIQGVLRGDSSSALAA